MITASIPSGDGEADALGLPDNSIALTPPLKKQDFRYLIIGASQDERRGWIEEINFFMGELAK